MAEISEAQRRTRRKAAGRRLIRKGSDLSVMRGDLQADPDMGFLTEKEKAIMVKLIKQLGVISGHLNKLGTRLDES